MLQIARVPNALAVNRCAGASWHPHRGVTALMQLALGSKAADVSLFTWTPVSGFTQGGNGVWEVDCGERGGVRARAVVVATNGYTHHLFNQGEGDSAIRSQ